MQNLAWIIAGLRTLLAFLSSLWSPRSAQKIFQVLLREPGPVPEPYSRPRPQPSLWAKKPWKTAHGHPQRKLFWDTLLFYWEKRIVLCHLSCLVWELGEIKISRQKSNLEFRDQTGQYVLHVYGHKCVLCKLAFLIIASNTWEYATALCGFNIALKLRHT